MPASPRHSVRALGVFDLIAEHMTDYSICGKGLAENADAAGDAQRNAERHGHRALDVHRQALDRTDPNSGPKLSRIRRSLLDVRAVSDWLD